MMLFLFPFFLHIISADELHICFYKDDESFCEPESQNFNVDNFSDYEKAELPSAQSIFFDFQSSLNDGDSITLSRFSSSAQDISFHGFENFSTPSISVTTDLFVPKNLAFENVEAKLDFNNFSNLTIQESPLTIKDKIIDADTLTCDGISISEINSITANKVMIRKLFSSEKEINIQMASKSESSSFTIREFTTVSLTANIIFSRICFSHGSHTLSASFDFQNWEGKLAINHSSLMEKEIVMNLRCLAYSPIYTFPYFTVNFVGILNLPKSNWPFSSEPLFEISGDFNLFFSSNTIDVGGFIPATVKTGLCSLSIDPIEPLSGFLKLTVEHDNLSINHPIILLDKYIFFINELETTLTKNTTVFCDPPLMYVYIDRFSHKKNSTGNFRLIGSGNYAIRSLPSAQGTSPTIYIEHLWLETNVTFPIDLESFSANVRILDFVLMDTWPTYFIPLYTGQQPEKIEKSSHKVICAKLLKEQKESLLLPVSGYPNGFIRGTSVLHSYFQQDPDTEQQMRCFGYNIKPNAVELSTTFCLADDTTKSNCPEGSLYISETDAWDAHVEKDAGELTFHLLRTDGGSTLSFAGFSMVNVSIIGSSNQKVAISPENVDWLSLSHVTASFPSSNSLLNLHLTNVVLSDSDQYKMGPLYTDAASLKSIKCSDSLQVPVTIKDITDTQIAFNADGSVTLKQSEVTLHTIDTENHTNPAVLVISENATDVTFEFEQSSADSTFIVKFTHEITANFANAQNSPKNLILDSFTGKLNLKQCKSVPFKLINAHDVEIESDQDIEFGSDFEISGSLKSSHDVTVQSLSANTEVETDIDTHLKTTNLTISANSKTAFASLAVSGTFSMQPGSVAYIENPVEFPTIISIVYNLTSIPLLYFGSGNKVAPQLISFENVASTYNIIIKNQTNALKDGIEIIAGLDCSKTQYEFRSEYIYYQGEYSLLVAKCTDQTIRLFLNDDPVAPPQPTPVPFIPTRSPTPDNTNKQVVIISCTVLAFFFIIIFVIVKCMNKKKKYVPKKQQVELNTTPLLEGNAE